ncbi:MAG: ATP-binding cassette domain-containing protein [Oligoflexales bacterium]
MPHLLYTQGFTPHNPKKKLKFEGTWDIEIDAGDFVCIYGDSGSGKSLFLKSLTLLYPPQSGNVYFQNMQVTSKEILFYRSKVIYLQQVPQFSDDTIAEEFNRIFRYKIYRNSYDRLQSDARQLADMIGLEHDIFTRKAYELSGGQKQKIHLVLGMCLNPHILILDEPTASLDEKSTLKVEKLLRDWVLEAKQDRAYLWVSHQTAQRKRVGKKFFQIVEGRLSAAEADEIIYSSASI